MQTAKRPHQKRYTLLGIAAIAVFTSAASANPGTAMLFVFVFHLFVGNLIIGIIEWIGLAMLGASKSRAAIMIPANYISAFAGFMILPFFRPLIDNDPVASIIWVSWGALITLTIFGVLIELPFVFLAFKKPRQAKRVIIATILVNIVTGGLVGGWYVLNSNLSLANNFDSVPIEEVTQEYTGPKLWIYFIDDKNQSINRMRLDGTNIQLVTRAPQEDGYDDYNAKIGYWLTLYDADNNNIYDLCYTGSILPSQNAEDQYKSTQDTSSWFIDDGGYERFVLLPDIANDGSIWTEEINNIPPVPLSSIAADLRRSSESMPFVSTSLSPWAPVEVRYPDGTTEPLALINAITSTSATIKVVTVLPGDLIVFMLGGIDSTTSHGIYLASLRTHKIAKIGNGRSPLVVFEDIDTESITEP
jgi:hypothetical protein